MPLLKLDWFSSHDRIKHVGIEIGATRPTDRSQLRINSHPSHFGRISKRLKDALELDELGKIDLPLNSVLKANLESMSARCSRFNNVFQHNQYSSSAPAAY